jgi:hypothetical protein
VESNTCGRLSRAEIHSERSRNPDRAFGHEPVTDFRFETIDRRLDSLSFKIVHFCSSSCRRRISSTVAAAPVRRCGWRWQSVEIFHAVIEAGAKFSYMTFNGQVPGPMIRVRRALLRGALHCGAYTC